MGDVLGRTKEVGLLEEPFVCVFRSDWSRSGTLSSAARKGSQSLVQDAEVS